MTDGLCNPHYQRQKKKGDVEANIPIGEKHGKRNGRWRGGQATMPDGRVLIYSPDHPNPGVAGLYVLRYRLVMEKVLGRFLRRDEAVHHLNGDVTDDRPCNLLVTSRGRHAQLHYDRTTYRWKSNATIQRETALAGTGQV